MHKIYRVLLGFFVGLCLSSQAFAQASLDLDQDGASDLTGVSAAGDGVLVWYSRISSHRQVYPVNIFGSSGDHLAPGRWTSANATNLVVLRMDYERGRVLWMLDDGSSSIAFGDERAYLISGADFDGSGTLDATRVIIRNGRLFWRVHYNPFVAGGRLDPEIQFGEEGDTPLFVSPDGVRDYFALFRASSTGAELVLMDPQSRGVSLVPFPKSLLAFGRPIPMRSGKGTDLLVFSRKGGDSTQFRFVNLFGRTVWRTIVRGNGTVVVGDFHPRLPGEEVALQVNKKKFTLLNSKRKRTAPLKASLDIPVDEVNVNAFGFTEPDPEPAPAPPAPGLGSCTGLDPSDGGGGFVWKPNSDTTYYAVAVMPGIHNGKINSVDVFTKKGAYIKTLTYYGCGNPDTAGPRCNYKDFSLTGADYRNQYGSIYLKVNFKKGNCGSYFIENPSIRYD